MFNPNQIRLENNRAIRKYEYDGTKLFLSTLRKQSEDFKPELMTEAYINFYQYVFVDSAKRNYTNIRKQEARKDFQLDGFFLNTWKEWIKQWVLANMTEIIAGVNLNTFNKIREITAQGIEDGLNPTQLAKLLYKEIGSKSRALAIAKTEGTTANNMGAERSAEDWATVTSSNLYKIWIHSSNPREPRESHKLAQFKPIPKGELFNIEGVGMKYPGDKMGGPKQTINCMCSVAYLSERLARRRYPKAFN